MQRCLLRALTQNRGRSGRCLSQSNNSAALSAHASSLHTLGSLQTIRMMIKSLGSETLGIQTFAASPFPRSNMLAIQALCSTPARAIVPHAMGHCQRVFPGAQQHHLGRLFQLHVSSSGATSSSLLGCRSFTGSTSSDAAWNGSHFRSRRRSESQQTQSNAQLSFVNGQGQSDDSDRCTA